MTPGEVALLIVVVVGVLGGSLALYAVSLHNGLVQVANNVEKAWSNVDVVLLQRHDELHNQLEVCKGYLAHEKAVFEDVTRLRGAYLTAAGIDAKAGVENELNHAVSRFRALWEDYPDLESDRIVLDFQDRITELEDRIADRREFFNDSVNVFNTQIERFPDSVVANYLGYSRHAYLEVPKAARRPLDVDLT